jgi:hypothetical protein
VIKNILKTLLFAFVAKRFGGAVRRSRHDRNDWRGGRDYGRSSGLKGMLTRALFRRFSR